MSTYNPGRNQWTCSVSLVKMALPVLMRVRYEYDTAWVVFVQSYTIGSPLRVRKPWIHTMAWHAYQVAVKETAWIHIQTNISSIIRPQKSAPALHQLYRLRGAIIYMVKMMS
jgi:hypothetical protein